jgi:hypothetical protein
MVFRLAIVSIVILIDRVLKPFACHSGFCGIRVEIENV